MVPFARLVNHQNFTTELPVPLFNNQSVFCWRHHVITVPDHMHKGNSGFCKRLERVDGISLIGQRCGLIGKAIGGQTGRPVLWAAAAAALAAGPAFEVAHGIVAINCHDIAGMLGGISLGIESAPADSDQGCTVRQTATDQLITEGLQLADCRR